MARYVCWRRSLFFGLTPEAATGALEKAMAKGGVDWAKLYRGCAVPESRSRKVAKFPDFFAGTRKRRCRTALSSLRLASRPRGENIRHSNGMRVHDAAFRHRSVIYCVSISLGRCSFLAQGETVCARSLRRCAPIAFLPPLFVYHILILACMPHLPALFAGASPPPRLSTAFKPPNGKSSSSRPSTWPPK